MLKTAGPFAIVLLTFHATEAAPLSFVKFNHLARECAPSVAPSTLAAIAKVESGFDPLAVHDNTTGETLHLKDQTDAMQGVKDRLEAGHSIDLGLMQVNSRNFPMLGLSPDRAFQPCASLSAAARLLARRYTGGNTAQEEQLALRQAISAYNTGSLTRGFANGYVRRVELAAQQLVPPLAEAPKGQDHEKQSPEEPWDVWGSYDRHRSAGEAGGSSGPPEPQKPNERKSQDDDQLLFELNDGGAS